MTVEALRRGEPQVLAELLAQHGREIQGVAYLILRNRADAEDVAADEHGLYYFVDGPGQVIRTWVLDVDGTRVVAWAFHFPEATAEGLAEEQAILDSVEFEPAN